MKKRLYVLLVLAFVAVVFCAFYDNISALVIACTALLASIIVLMTFCVLEKLK